MLLIFIPLYIAVTLAIGFWASRRVKTTKDFIFQSVSDSIIWFVSDRIKTRIDPIIYGTIASCIGMILGSLFRPDLPKPLTTELFYTIKPD